MFKTLAALSFLTLASPLQALNLEELAGDKNLWKLPRDQVEKKAKPLAFVWVSATQESLRTDNHDKIFGLKSGETLIRFDPVSGLATGIQISLYNRGDVGEISEKDFNALITQARVAVGKIAATKERSIKGDRQSAVRSDGAVWSGAEATYRLEWNNTKISERRPEFLTLHILPAGKADEIIKAAAGATANPTKSFAPADHLETNPAGDKWIKDVPMVDQGQKGYCAVATTERVLRFYGLEIDEHELAQLADSSSTEGTNMRNLEEALIKNAGRLKVRMKLLLTTDSAFYQSLADDYNAAAQKTKVPRLPNPRTNWNAFATTFDFKNLDAATLLLGRKKNTSGLKQFERLVATAIDKGTPIIWSVTLGIAPETPALPQSKGGHMRLIIGYNARNHTIVYSDSWGAGHERKVMAADTAFAITDGMMTLNP
jgi:hypothetical protein